MENIPSPTSSTPAPTLSKTYIVEDKEDRPTQVSPSPLVESKLALCGQSTIVETSMINVSMETNANCSSDKQDTVTPSEETTQKTKDKKRGKEKVHHQNDQIYTPIARKTRSHDGKETINYQETKEEEEKDKSQINPEEVLESIMAHAMTIKDYEEVDTDTMNSKPNKGEKEETEMSED